MKIIGSRYKTPAGQDVLGTKSEKHHFYFGEHSYNQSCLPDRMCAQSCFQVKLSTPPRPLTFVHCHSQTQIFLLPFRAAAKILEKALGGSRPWSPACAHPSAAEVLNMDNDAFQGLLHP